MEIFEKKEKATDMELALFLIQHINSPCENPQKTNIRNFYIREAKRALDTFQNPQAKQLLEDAIQKYPE
jgi:hypothetical protein